MFFRRLKRISPRPAWRYSATLSFVCFEMIYRGFLHPGSQTGEAHLEFGEKMLRTIVRYDAAGSFNITPGIFFLYSCAADASRQVDRAPTADLPDVTLAIRAHDPHLAV